jgi:hypothetical protein
MNNPFGKNNTSNGVGIVVDKDLKEKNCGGKAIK